MKSYIRITFEVEHEEISNDTKKNRDYPDCDNLISMLSGLTFFIHIHEPTDRRPVLNIRK